MKTPLPNNEENARKALEKRRKWFDKKFKSPIVSDIQWGLYILFGAEIYRDQKFIDIGIEFQKIPLD